MAEPAAPGYGLSALDFALPLGSRSGSGAKPCFLSRLHTGDENLRKGGGIRSLCSDSFHSATRTRLPRLTPCVGLNSAMYHFAAVSDAGGDSKYFTKITSFWASL
jgi:hypothetical protein